MQLSALKPFLNKRWQKELSNWHYLPTCDSTNQFLLNKANQNNNGQDNNGQNSIDKCFVICDEQLAGRGRKARAWFSEPQGSLLFSIGKSIPQTFLNDNRLHLLSLMTGIALCQTLESLGIKSYVKWPNDVMLSVDNGFAKVAGILIESQFKRHEDMQLVLGIGINLASSNKIKEQAVQKVAAIYPDSFYLMPNIEQERAKFLAQFLNHLLPFYFDLHHVNVNDVLQAWQRYDFFTLNDWLYVKTNTDNDFEPMQYQGINEQGHIMFLNQQKNMQHFHSADIQIRKDW